VGGQSRLLLAIRSHHSLFAASSQPPDFTICRFGSAGASPSRLFAANLGVGSLGEVAVDFADGVTHSVNGSEKVVAGLDFLCLRLCQRNLSVDDIDQTDSACFVCLFGQPRRFARFFDRFLSGAEPLLCVLPVAVCLLNLQPDVVKSSLHVQISLFNLQLRLLQFSPNSPAVKNRVTDDEVECPFLVGDSRGAGIAVVRATDIDEWAMC
jgi:hypothetical protein